MSNLFPARSWREKPSGLVTPYYGNPHTHGLIAAWNFFEGAGTRLHDMVGNNHGILTGSNIDWHGGGVQERTGAKFTGDATTDRFDQGSIATGNPLMLNNTDFTIMMKTRPRPPYNNAFPTFVSKSDGSSGANGYVITLEPLRIGFYTMGAGVFGTGGLNRNDLDNLWFVCAVTVRLSDKQVSFYVNSFDLDFPGIRRGGPMRLLNTATAGTLPGTTTTNMAIGNSATATDREWAGDISWIYVWDRLLGLDEVNEVALAPHALFQPVTSRTYLAMQTHADLGPLGDNQITVISG